MRNFALLCLTLGAFALVACGGDDTGKTPDKGATKVDKKVITATDGEFPDLPPVQTDTGITSTCGAPVAAKANSGASCGQTCTAAADCATNNCVNSTGAACTAGDTQCICDCASSDEVCISGLSNAAGDPVSMCVGKCCANPNDVNDPANVCPVTDDQKQASLCKIPIKDAGFMGCVWFCEVPDGKGGVVKADCPNATDYDCVSGLFTNPEVKACAPKQ